jgi:hypothetical protein
MSNFTTKDSKEHKTFSTGMQRDTDSDKPRFDLITPEQIPYSEQMLTRWASRMTMGAKKYDQRNWEKAETTEELNRFINSAFRHFMQWLCGEVDEDHASAVFFNIQGAEYVKYKLSHNKHLITTDEDDVCFTCVRNKITALSDKEIEEVQLCKSCVHDKK